MSQHKSNYEPHERVIHKLLGAAYQMTFDGEYDMAVQTSVTAVTYWRKIEDGSIDQDEAAALIGRPSSPSAGDGGNTSTETAKADGGTAAVNPGAEPKATFACETCGKEFESQAAVDGHQSAHVDEENRGGESDESGLDALFESDDAPKDNSGKSVSINPDTQRHEIAKLLVYGPKDSYSTKEVGRKVDFSASSAQAHLSRMDQAGWVTAERESANKPFQYTPTYDLKKRVQEIGESS